MRGDAARDYYCRRYYRARERVMTYFIMARGGGIKIAEGAAGGV